MSTQAGGEAMQRLIATMAGTLAPRSGRPLRATTVQEAHHSGSSRRVLADPFDTFVRMRGSPPALSLSLLRLERCPSM
jgi:hypothetical protein